MSLLLDPTAWGAAFDSLVLPIAGFLFLPWLTIAFVLLAPGGISTGELIVLIGALLVDLGTWGIGIIGARSRRSDSEGT